MEHENLLLIPAPLIAIVFFAFVMFFNWMGFRFKKRNIRLYPNHQYDGLGTLEGALLGLMALLLSFAFGMSASKFEYRRDLVIQEANNIGTAILRCDLYPDSVRKVLREGFSHYVDARIEYYDAGDHPDRVKVALDKAARYSGGLWKIVADIAARPENPVRSQLMVPAMNAMIDIVTTRDASRKAPVPMPIFLVLLLLTFTCSFLAGYGVKENRRNHVLMLAFAVMTTLTFYLVLELGRPRQGFINLDRAEAKIVELKSMLQ